MESRMKQVMMVGAGAVGGFFGAHLATHNPGVSFLLRPRTLQAVREHGLTIRSAEGTFTVRPPAAADPRDLPQPDLIILSVKAYDLDDVMDQIADLFKRAGLTCQVVEDIRRSKWEKMCWNCVFNPLTVIINDRVSKALDHPEMLQVIPQIVGEVGAVAAGLKVPLSPDMADKVVRWSQEIRDIHTSMYDDWKAGRPTEIDFLNGYIVQRGRDLGIPTPLNEALTAMVKVITELEKSGPGILRIEGAVIQPIMLDCDALAKLPAEYQISDVGALVPGMRGRGVRMKGVLEVPALTIGADHATFHSADGRFAASLTLKQATEHGILIYQLDEEPLSEQNGGP